MNNKIKDYLQRKQNPELAITEAIADIKADIDNVIAKAVSERFSALEQELKGKEANMDMVDKITRNVLKDIKGEKGDFVKGDDGLTPTDEELLILIKPLIPEVKDGHTPTSEEVLAIIKPLIPKVKDGATPTRQELLDLIIPLIPTIENGKDGKDGNIIKPEEISTKLNTLEEVLDTKVLKGFKKIIKQLEEKIFYASRSKSKGGGGVGNGIDETFAVGSSTTTSTLQNKIAGGGSLIWVYYSGQHLVRGTHYTLSGKVITWLTTFADNTYADVTYIRTS